MKEEYDLSDRALLLTSLMHPLLQFVEFLNGLNLSTKFFIKIPGNQNQSYFGYTVHLRSNSNKNGSSVIIGAPKANSKFKTTVTNPGSIYQCDQLLNGNPNCNEFLLNEKDIIETSGFKYDAYPEHGSLGASIDGEDTRDGRFVACAPRWSSIIPQYDSQTLLNNGICYWSSNTVNDKQSVTDMTPLIDTNRQKTEKSDGTSLYIYQYGEFGFSTHLTKASEVIFGSPGLNNWIGGVIQYKDWNKTISTNDYNRRRRSIEEKLFGQTTISKVNLPEGVYFGYAVSSGNFENEMNEISYVASAPKYEDKGGVFIFKFEKSNDKNKQIHEKPVRIYKQFIGEQVGEYFGASLCVIDVNGDHLDDVIIGAPRYSYDRDDVDSGDEGRVYVFINKGNWEFEKHYFLNFNDICSSQFGTSVSSLGDLDQDGFNDIVVGAPYENYGRGAIYIYLGGKNGLNPKASQYFRAKDLNENLFGFGFSVSRGVDIDNNYYNDLAVGAYISGDVVLFRSHPVAYLTGTIISSVPKLNLNTKQFNIKVCVEYNGKFVPRNINVSVDIRTDGPSFEPNIVVRDLKTIQNIEIMIEKCFPHKVYLNNRIRDFSIPVKVSMQLSIYENKMNNAIFCSTCPILHPNSKHNVSLSIPFSNGCKTDICYPELALIAYFTNPSFTIGSRDNLILNISIKNSGEPAYVY
ncbi:integrin alpha-PS3-like [Chrysoperla carnea]|uniref:integrin alpha-PS3-like n=1 Tax=Chrysoperla carnea TaxID=189513 RepID=UPI001D083CED|nr:integrin alpha-PS3-like [Chrysoperla carnea]